MKVENEEKLVVVRRGRGPAAPPSFDTPPYSLCTTGAGAISLLSS